MTTSGNQSQFPPVTRFFSTREARIGNILRTATSPRDDVPDDILPEKRVDERLLELLETFLEKDEELGRLVFWTERELRRVAELHRALEEGIPFSETETEGMDIQMTSPKRALIGQKARGEELYRELASLKRKSPPRSPRRR